MMTKLPPPDGRDAALAWLYAMSQADAITAMDAKLEAKRAEINAAIDDANERMKSAEFLAAELVADARKKAQEIEGTANDTAKRVTAEAIQAKREAEGDARRLAAMHNEAQAKQMQLDAALAEVRKAEDEAQARLASLKDSQAKVEELRKRLEAMTAAGEKAA